MGTALDVTLEASSELIAHEPHVSMVQSITLTAHAHRICGKGTYGTAAVVLARWQADLRLPAAVRGRPFDVRVIGGSAAIVPNDSAQADLHQGCTLSVGAATTDDLRPGTRDVLRTTAPAGTSVPIVLDCSGQSMVTGRALLSLGCIGVGDDPAWAAPVEKELRLTLEFHVAPSP